MNTNIEITNINRNFLPILAENSNECVARKHNTILTKHCFYSINEAVISDKIKQIRYYSNNFFVAETYNFVNIGQLNEQVVEKLKLTNDVRYQIFKYKNENLVGFSDFLFNIADPTRFVFSAITSFSYILTSLRTLNKNDVCFFNLSPQNIVFNLDCGENPVIRNFQTSLQISQLNVEYITNIIKAQHDYTHKPLEVHVLFYLIQNNLSTISYSFIEEICEEFVKNLPFLNIFSEKFGTSYKETCVASLKKYINRTQTDIISDILENRDKWDVYSLSVIYLHIFGGISRVFSLQHNFITKLTTALCKNVHPNPANRSSLDDLFANYNRLLSDENNWSFVNKMSRNKMPQLFSILGE